MCIESRKNRKLKNQEKSLPPEPYREMHRSSRCHSNTAPKRDWKQKTLLQFKLKAFTNACKSLRYLHHLYHLQWANFWNLSKQRTQSSAICNKNIKYFRRKWMLFGSRPCKEGPGNSHSQAQATAKQHNHEAFSAHWDCQMLHLNSGAWHFSFIRLYFSSAK